LRSPLKSIKARKFDDAIDSLDFLIDSYSISKPSESNSKDLALIICTRGNASYLKFKYEDLDDASSRNSLRNASIDVNKALELDPKLKQGLELKNQNPSLIPIR